MRGRLKLFCIYTVSIIAVFAPTNTCIADQADSIYQEGLALESNGQKDFAVFKYFAVVRNYPNSRWADDALFKIAEFYYLNNDYYNAKLSLVDLIRKYPQSNFAPDSKLYLEKIAGITRASNIENSAQVLIGSMEALKSQERWDDIMAACDELASFQPLPGEYKEKLLGYYRLCAEAYAKLNDTERAKSALEKLIKIKPDDAETLKKLYEINAAQGAATKK